ncbi:succinate dehydrogenase flavoprotein subunit [Oxobacter pfennigii]|uniref:Succinate dehydrogenase flavoprotein subunit n=1 Tax=Oxobacter pfennigii TaxID=36849 RepID=A0A0N8NTD4_9CLOT|nr:FAD-binding protein [Oxobacter pfennigii]KPU44520.1 succinate dehydrogenase flavoprotein subunit [Oxobacter pfennigii]
MKHDTVNISGLELDVYSLNTVVVGSGAAGFNAASRLHSLNQTDIAIVTEHINAGTSRNTGSDKQTYYKLTLSGAEPDSVGELAQTLFAGGCVDGDVALAEAALSARCFLRLCDLGVPFPVNRYGEYIGYKTDHDPRRRATSVGPLTSKHMTEALERDVISKNIKIFDSCQVVKVLTENDTFLGLLCLNLIDGKDKPKFTLFNCKSVIFATGGPAGMYADSVYPFGHYGSSGIAFEAGVMGRNLTEWQYGLASVKPRWNVSGTYMQVLPKFISTGKDENDEREFLTDFFKDYGEMLSRVFMKGYQWPFDVRKIIGGSSIVDILVYIETCIKGRRVFLDFRNNPGDCDIDFKKLDNESYEYLDKAGALFGTPIERLLHMNTPAYEFYLSRGVDLKKQPLEIALCAQHNNGGIAIDKWWQSNIEGFFAAGEAAGSHGIYRPGGSALNAGQVGSTRAAQFVASNRKGEALSVNEFIEKASEKIEKVLDLSKNLLSHESNIDALWENAQKRMSRAGAAIRDSAEIERALNEVKNEIESFDILVKADETEKLSLVYRLYDMLLSQYVYLSSMADYVKMGGKSRGSSFYSDKSGRKVDETLPDVFSFNLDDGSKNDLIQEVVFKDGKCLFSWRPVRDIPKDDDFFENVWRSFRENGNVY